MPAKLVLRKLDRRYGGHDRFSHRIEFVAANRDFAGLHRAWVSARIWLWESFGPSAELWCAHEKNFNGVQPKWAWDSDKSAIYLKEEPLSAFLLKKEYWENA
jgi:hypothetical protein